MLTNDYSLRQTNLLLRDGLDERDIELDALAQSGDCFITLATTLDELTHQHALPEAVKSRLESATRSLIYLQQHYKVEKKHPDYRQ
jgi:hypothetical protein